MFLDHRRVRRAWSTRLRPARSGQRRVHPRPATGQRRVRSSSRRSRGRAIGVTRIWRRSPSSRPPWRLASCRRRPARRMRWQVMPGVRLLSGLCQQVQEPGPQPGGEPVRPQLAGFGQRRGDRERHVRVVGHQRRRWKVARTAGAVHAVDLGNWVGARRASPYANPYRLPATADTAAPIARVLRPNGRRGSARHQQRNQPEGNQAPVVQRIRIRYAKRGPLRFTSRRTSLGRSSGRWPG